MDEGLGALRRVDVIRSDKSQPRAKMLVVDDDPRSRKLLAGYLQAEGYDVRVAPDGPKALTEVQRELPDVILLDVMMPHMTGYEVCETLKSDPQTRLAQVMLVTALDSTPDRVEGLDIGADDYVCKPVRREEFLAKVRALVRARELLLSLERARADLAQRNEELQLKKTLAQSLVHDLKNPLSAILGNLDLLEIRGGDELRTMIDRSKEGARRMLKMILNLLDVEGLEEGQLRPTASAFDLSEIARATVEDARTLAEQKGVTIALDAAESTVAEVDPILMRRVVDNLLSNALSHTPAGGNIVVRVNRRAEGIGISVSDDGPGVPEEHRERVFEKYEQLKLRRAGIASNRGLGLTFCRLAVEAHGGTIWVEAAESGGACFQTVLPEATPETTSPELPTLVAKG